MLVTLFVDASFFDRSHAAAYGFYAISQLDRLVFSSRFKGHIKSSAHAEYAAVANALSITLKHPLAAQCTRVLVQTDCKAVVDWINGGESRAYPEVAEAIRALQNQYRVRLIPKWVPGHTGTHEPRLYCQDQCDREAKHIARRMHREECDRLGIPVRIATPPKRRKRS